MHLLWAIVLSLASITLIAARCEDGLTLVSDFSDHCCISPGTGSVPGANCNIRYSTPPVTICSWTRQPDDVRFTYVVPPGITTATTISMAGTYGELLNGATLDPSMQRGGMIAALQVPISGRTLTIYPGSYYGGLGAGMPPDQSRRGLDWARGGGASALIAGWSLIAAGGGGQGSLSGFGGNADQGGPYQPYGSAGGIANGGFGGGGAGLIGGAAGAVVSYSPYTCGAYTCYQPVYMKSGGGMSGALNFPAAFYLVGSNTDPAPSYPLVFIYFGCGDPVPTTTVSLPTPASTEFTTVVSTIVEQTTVPTPTHATTVTVERARPPEYVDSTLTPDSSYTTRTHTTTTYPPESIDYSTVTPATSYFTESPSVTTTPATSTIYETSTPPTRYFTETVAALVTPATTFTTTTVTPATNIIPTTITELRTVSSGTSTSVISSATRAPPCSQYRMVYPPACCPRAYIEGIKAWRFPETHRRRGLVFARDLTTVYTPSGTTTSTVETTTTTTAFFTPDPVFTTETDTTPGPITTLTNTVTASTGTITVDETSTVEGVASTTTITLTADAPSFTFTKTQYFEAATPLSTDISTANAPSSTETDASYSTLPTPVSTVQEQAARPLSTSTSTLTQFNTVPATTTTTTAYALQTKCVVKTAQTAKCPYAILRKYDQALQLTLIKANKLLSGNRPVQIDCGSAGVWSYT